MVKVTVVIREIQRPKPDYFLDFNLPEVPKVGDYISVFRPDAPRHSEDLVVRHVWWHLKHPETRAITTGEPLVGSVQDIMVECDVALGPYASDRWRLMADGAAARGATVDEFDVERFSARQSDLKN